MSTVHLRVNSWCCTFYGFGRCTKPCIDHYNVTQSRFAALNFLRALSVHLSPPTPKNHTSFDCLPPFVFPRMSCGWNHTGCSLFGLFSLLCNMHVMLPVSSQGSIAYFFSGQNNILLPGYTVVSLFIHLLKGILVASKFWPSCSFFFFFLIIFRATSSAYGSSQARGLIGATAVCLCHSHNNTGSELCLRPTL